MATVHCGGPRVVEFEFEQELVVVSVDEGVSINQELVVHAACVVYVKAHFGWKGRRAEIIFVIIGFRGGEECGGGGGGEIISRI